MECPWQKVHIAVLGCGFMGTAILQGLLSKTKQNQKPAVEYTAWVRSEASLHRLQQTLANNKGRVNCVAGGNIVEHLSSADVVILGFPPGELDNVSSTPGLVDTLRGKLIISLLAGTSYAKLAKALQQERVPGRDRNTFRVIPSIGAKISDSVTLVAETSAAGDEQQKVASWIFEQVSQSQWLPESLMDEATAAGAACNALTMIAVDAIVDASVAEGIPRDSALKLAAASLRSASGLLLDGGMTPESLKESMSVPKGITINSALELERGRVRPGISDAVRHAIQYTRNMSG